MNIKGKVPKSKRPASNPFSPDDELFGNALSVPQEIKEELDRKGLEGRFVDAEKLYKMGGYHPKGWVPYKRDKKEGDTLGTVDWKFGSDPEGVIRRGSVILAVKSKESAQKHRDYLVTRAERLSPQNFDKEKAEELRQVAKDNRADAVVTEGYEDNA